MAEDDDWGLQAVVRGCGGGATSTAATTNMSSSSSLPLIHLEKESRGVASVEDDLLFCCFPDLFSTPSELEDLYKPFVFAPNRQQQEQQKQQQLPVLPPISPLPISTTTSTTSSSLSRTGGVTTSIQPEQQQHPKPLLPLQNPRSKRRKCQQQRVVCQVPADGLPSDLWAWRKYGQKPIKGSPFPRGYYRCSSSKGCMARKQVERSKTDPNAMVITYTGEHSHPPPTHRNSLAGSTRYNTLSATSAPADLCPSTSRPTASPKEENENEELEEEGLLNVSDVELLGEEDMVVMGLETETNHDHEVHDPLCSAEALSSPFLWMANSGSAASGSSCSSHRALAQSLV